ncbi:hypothetical protein GF327_05105 [Candidatus Woesearchaeota archaeon]|nr:hypothetical protein [Candidatus Woesearchaeota archaeon]
MNQKCYVRGPGLGGSDISYRPHAALDLHRLCNFIEETEKEKGDKDYDIEFVYFAADYYDEENSQRPNPEKYKEILKKKKGSKGFIGS